MPFRIKEATLDHATQNALSPLRRAEDIEPRALVTESPKSTYHVAWNSLEVAISQGKLEDAEQAVGILSSEVMMHKRIFGLGVVATGQILLNRAGRQPSSTLHTQNTYLSLAGAIIETRSTQHLNEGNRNGALAELIFMALANRGAIPMCSAAPREESSTYRHYNHDCVAIDALGKRAFSIKASKKKSNKKADHPVATVSIDDILQRALDKAAIPAQSKSDLYLIRTTNATVIDRVSELIVRDALTPFVQSSAEQQAMEALTSATKSQIRNAPHIIR